MRRHNRLHNNQGQVKIIPYIILRDPDYYATDYAVWIFSTLLKEYKWRESIFTVIITSCYEVRARFRIQEQSANVGAASERDITISLLLDGFR